MPSLATLARRSQALRTADFSNLCWTCLLAQRRQLSNVSPLPQTSPRSSSRKVRYKFVNIPPKPPGETGQLSPAAETSLEEAPRTAQDYHKDEERLLAQLVDQHRRQATEQQDAIDRIARSSSQNVPASKRSFHTSSRVSIRHPQSSIESNKLVAQTRSRRHAHCYPTAGCCYNS